MDSIAHELACALLAVGPDGAPIYDDRDRSVAIAILAAVEGSAWAELGQARVHVHRLYEWANVAPGDDAATARTKIASYLDREPIHPALTRQLSRILRRAVANLADPRARRHIHSDWANEARTEPQRTQARGSLVRFMIQQRKTDA